MPRTLPQTHDTTPDDWQEFFAASNPAPAFIRWLVDTMAGRTPKPAS